MTGTSLESRSISAILEDLRRVQSLGLPGSATTELAFELLGAEMRLATPVIPCDPDSGAPTGPVIPGHPNLSIVAEAHLAIATAECRSERGLKEADYHAKYALNGASIGCADPLLIVRCQFMVAEIERHMGNLVDWNRYVSEAAKLVADQPALYGYVSLTRGRKLLATGYENAAARELALAVELLNQGAPNHVIAIATAHLAFALFACSDPAAVNSLKRLHEFRTGGVQHTVVTEAYLLLRHIAHGHSDNGGLPPEVCALRDGPKFRDIMWI